MKKLELKYIGYQNKQYIFLDESDSTIRFSGARSDLIHEFDLRNTTNVKSQFEVAYFSTHDGDNESMIISDLKIISDI
tara:strand:+ start:535 stop:768 length:234 start_codon:yes stop_codon:yes gene_type:complete